MQGFDADLLFDRLLQHELDELLHIARRRLRYRPGEVIVRQAHASEQLHVVIKGSVEVRESGSLQLAAWSEGQLQLSRRRSRRGGGRTSWPPKKRYATLFPAISCSA